MTTTISIFNFHFKSPSALPAEGLFVARPVRTTFPKETKKAAHSWGGFQGWHARERQSFLHFLQQQSPQTHL